MSKPAARHAIAANRRRPRFEALERRLMFAAGPLPKLQITAAQTAAAQTTGTVVLPPSYATNAAAYSFTGLNLEQSTYGFTGQGQTVAVIDTGAAYDSAALGGGMGPGDRVVGGWDFADNDANPYDFGPAGGHGTAVSGIIGSSNPTTPGLAPAVDLVELRVFNYAGNTNFAWVDQALQWVYSHRNSFQFPITTVNLSLGTTWNSTTVPQWATLEADLKQLDSVGIFISVAAGNQFASFDTPGLSYPAASPYVVPVMSVGASDTISPFSQRASDAIAAPGENIRSTVPDYLGNLNGKDDDFATFSGTSMSAPYAAGASVLLRQAMEFEGDTNINETTLYSIMRDTADSVYDPITKSNYLVLNIDRAIASVVRAGTHPVAAPGSGATANSGAATNSSPSGPAAAPAVAAPVSLVGGVLTVNGTAGNDTLQVTIGNGVQLTLNGTAYQYAAGTVTALNFAGSGGTDSVALTFTSTAGSASAIFHPGSLAVSGAPTAISISGAANITVAASGTGNHATFYDSAGADTFTDSSDSATLQGTGYHNTAQNFQTVDAYASGGGDTARLYGGAGTNSFLAGPALDQLINNALSATVHGFATVQAFAASGAVNSVTFTTSSANDSFQAAGTMAALLEAQATIWASGFSQVTAIAAPQGKHAMTEQAIDYLLSDEGNWT